MPKAKSNQKLINWLIAHPWLKLIAAMLAVITWLYVKEAMNRF